jgi:hypothetical protein
MAQQFEQPLDNSNLRAQRMTADESRAVIELWQQEQTELTGLTDKPAVPDVAEGLDITVEDVQRLLQNVRARRLEEARRLAQEQTELRLAQEERKLAEVQRQRAGLHREQAEARRRSELRLSHPSTLGQKASPLSRKDLVVQVFLLGFVMLSFVYFVLMVAFQK